MNIHTIMRLCEDIAAREETTKEQLYNGVQALYVEACNITGKKPMTSRQWERKVRRLKAKGLPQKERASLDDLFAITTTVSTFDDSTNEDVMNGIKRMYDLTLSKL